MLHRLLAATFLIPGGAAAAPYRPLDDAQVVERVRPGPRPVAPSATHDLTVAVTLARTWIERGRRHADPRYLGYAEAALLPWLHDSRVPEVLILRATLRQSRHEFAPALADLDRALALRPGDAQALLTRATILRVQGRYAEAARDCAALGAGFSAALCAAAVRGLSGELGSAREQMEALLPAAAAQDASLRVWLAAERADAAERAGDAAAAETVYRQALSEFPDDWALRVSLADLWLAQRRDAEVLELLDGREPIDALALRELLALQALGRPHAVQAQRVEAGFAAAARRGEAPHLRDAARHALEVRRDAATGLALALDNWSAQREPADARLELEAADAAGQPQAAAAVRTWLAQTRMQDARLAAWLHATR